MANTLSAALVPDTAADMAITVLQNKLASLSVFSTDFSSDLVDPTRPMAIPVVTGGSTTLTSPTDFEQGDSTVTSELVSPVHISQPFHVTQAELNSGHKLERLFKVNLRKFADAINANVYAPLTAANYTNAVVVAATPADLDTDALKTVWSSLSNADEKNIVLKGDYYANYIPATRDNFELSDGLHGFDKFRMSNFTGAEANVVGFAADPQAMAIASRVPAMSDAARDAMIEQRVIDIPDLGIGVQFCMWFSLKSRTTWASFDICVGSAKADASALTLIKSA